MPLFLQIALGIILAILGIIALLALPGFAKAFVDEALRSHPLVMVGRMLLLPALVLMATFTVQTVIAAVGEIKHPGSVVSLNAVLSGPLAISLYVVLGLCAGCNLLGRRLEDRAEAKKAQAGTGA